MQIKPRIRYDDAPSIPEPVVWWQDSPKGISVSGYFIEWERIRGQRNLIGWIWHLTDKDWITNQHIEELIAVWAEKANFTRPWM